MANNAHDLNRSAGIAVQAPLDALRRAIEAQDYKGYDPYDALNSPLVRVLTLGSKAGRIAWTQCFRRSPVNLRPLMGVPRQWNPKALGLFLWGYARAYARDPQPETRDRIGYLIDALKQTRSPGTSGPAWGYNFAWQSRAFHIPAYTPTIVNTAFIGHALLDTYEATQNADALELALPIHRFLLEDLNRTPWRDHFCFSYTPLDHTTVHNANLLGASLLARLHAHVPNAALLDAAESALAYSMAHQRDDGSWYYADTDIQRWIDSFHTGFNLQAIRYFLERGLGDSYADAYAHGVEFYATHFFETDGAPRYYHDRLYPIDIHCPAQAVAFFSGMGPAYHTLTDRVLSWMIDNLYDERSGIFYFRKGRVMTNHIPYMRWSLAWAFHALHEYAYHRESPGS